MSHSEIPWISSCEARTAWWYTQRMSPCSWCSLPVCVSTKLHISCRTCLLVFGAYRSLGSQRSECKTLIIYFKPKTLWLSPKNCFFIFLDKGQKKVLNFPFRFPVIEWKNRTFTLRSLPGKMRNVSSVLVPASIQGSWFICYIIKGSLKLFARPGKSHSALLCNSSGWFFWRAQGVTLLTFYPSLQLRRGKGGSFSTPLSLPWLAVLPQTILSSP